MPERRAIAPQPTRILLTADAVGGVWRYATDLAAGFSARGWDVVLAVLGPAPDAAQLHEAGAIPRLDLRITGLTLDWAAPEPAALLSVANHLASLARGAGVGSVHLHSPALAADAAWPAPVVAVAHSCGRTWWRSVQGGAPPADMAWRARAMERGMAQADAIVAPSFSFADDLADAYGPGPIEVILNGRAAAPPAPPGPRIAQAVTAGRLWDAGKNIALLDAASALLPAPILAAGPLAGPDGSTVKLAHMHWLGALAAQPMRAAFAAHTVFASASRYEPFGLTALEAAQAGMALVLSDIPTHRELWDGAAIFAPADNAEAFAAAIRRALENPLPWAERAQNRAAGYGAEPMVDATARLHLEVRTRHLTPLPI